MKRRKVSRTGHILRRNCLLKQVIEGEIEGRIEVTARRGRRRQQLLENLKESRGYWKFQEEAINFFMYNFGWLCISLQILAKDQLDALFHVFIYFISLHVSSISMLSIRRSNCINTLSGTISLCKWLIGMLVRRELLCSSLLTGIPNSHLDRLIVPDDVLIQFDLLILSIEMLETCREMK